MIRIPAPAKINLRLLVLAREDTGYHSLETLFCGIDLADELEVQKADEGVRLEVQGDVDTGPAEKNLVVRAAHAFLEESGLARGVTIRLRKRIPAEAGLGGGSSDGAATLRALNSLYEEPIDPDRLLEVGATLGSDVAFFLSPTPYALAWGRGQRLMSLPPLPQAHVLVAKPDDAIATPAAFARLSELREGNHPHAAGATSTDRLGSWQRVAKRAVNDLEPPAFEAIPSLPDAKRELVECGASLALLAGSGSSLFGIFHEEDALAGAEKAMRRMGLRTWRCRTLNQWPEPGSRD